VVYDVSCVTNHHHHHHNHPHHHQMAPPAGLLSSLDLCFSIFFVGPFTVLFWRGTFNTLADTAFKDLPTLPAKWFPALLLFLIGLLIKICIDVVKHIVRPILTNYCAIIQYLSVSVILYLDATSGVVMWVGGFNLLYVFPSLYWYSLTSVLFISTSILMFLQAFHSTSGTPLAIHVDNFESVLVPSSYFGTTLENSGLEKVILDTVFSYSIVHSLVISLWWSMWELENRYILYPCEITVKDFQAWDSVVLAFFLVFVVVTIQESVKEVDDGQETFKKRSAVNSVAFLAFLASLNFWRGIWSLQDFYFFPDMDMKTNLLLSHLLGFLATLFSRTSLTLTQSSRKDVSPPKLVGCQYWSLRGLCGARQGYQEIS